MRYTIIDEKLPRDSMESKKLRKTIIIGTVIFFLIAVLIVTICIINTHETRESRALRIEREQAKFWDSITREEILYDIDHMLYVLEHNFPFLDSIYDRFGVNMLALGKELRVTFEDETFIPDMHEFISLVDDFLLQAHRVGHLRVWKRDMFARSTDWRAETELSSQTIMFYGDVDEIDAQEARHIMYETVPHIISTEIIEEDRIGYMKINGMYPLGRHDNDIIWSFFREIADFEHLIIDLRGNRGGLFDSMILIASPLMRWNATAEFHLFFPQGDLNFAHIENAGLSRERMYWPIIPFSYDFAESRIRRKNIGIHREADWIRELITESEYFITTRMVGLRRANTTLRTDFSGQIWVLTDGITASAAELMTAIMNMNSSALNGSAIIVGERTSGIIGNPIFMPVIFALPNTGMLIEYDFAYVYDRNGRPLSDGIDPDYWNRPGMDALETTLALISEGVYR